MAAVVAYRNILRAARVAFQGDAPVLLAAQSQIRGEFRSKQSLDPQDSSVSEGIAHATQVATFLRENLVQGKKMEGEESKYKLRIHEHTERGDNESIKTAVAGVSGGGCCGGPK
ncbi:hypothetical protein CCM_08654 [Cordyceps militaris CM01]|uniref:Mitochondrial zinc maintenance protein 1, mitochondrial n=2 Tax=Cordyceps militaris TaxID=73501 RepID=G3JRK6_CORMM|nr:uncharacterized protein CCM_08654 [Cordyceps militaris CM01]ATY62379.1 hypothetical protein A9K55_008907 [Cordyceps militaris]EGX88609.1 hypothetical protein CCM_08654 [Cordyceps militaris CM01]